MSRAFGRFFFVVGLALAALALVRNDAAAATYQDCPGGICEPAILCPPWTTWDDSAKQCRTVVVCPGESQVLVTGGQCELHCGSGREPDPFKPHHCRTAFQCPHNRVEIEPNVCEISCPEGERQNPWRQGVCRKPFECPFGEIEVAEGVCQIPCPPGREENSEGVCACKTPTAEIGGSCAVPAAETCGGAGMIYNSATAQCENPETCEIGTEAVGGKCQSVCRDRIIRTHYDPEIGGCVCPPGAAGDNCRELDRTHATLATGVPFAHAQSLGDGTPLLGKGVVIAVTEAGPAHWIPNIGDDTTLTPNNPSPPAAAPTTHSELPDFPVFGYDPRKPTLGKGSYDGTAQEAFHGVAVLGVMAARKDGKGLVGVAPEADYLYGNVNGTVGTFSLVRILAEGGADIFNHSWGPEEFITADDFADPGGNLAKTRANLREYALRGGFGAWRENIFGVRITGLYIDEIERGRFSIEEDYLPPADRQIHVWSAGNYHLDSITVDIQLRDANGDPLRILRAGNVVNATVPGVFAGLPKYFPELTLNHLAVAALQIGPNYRVIDNGVTLFQSSIADFSNRCGANSESFCISAPGEAILGRPGWINVAISLKTPEFLRAQAEVRRKYPDCVNPGFLQRHLCENQILKEELVLERFRTGFGSGVVLAPDTDEYRQAESRLPKGYDRSRGTSFSAPVVSGALALMKQFFMAGTNCGAGSLCGLGSHELVARILATADKRGIYADVSTYGAGLLDLENALTPQGELMFLSGRSVGDSSGRSASESALRTGPALGDAAANAMRGEVLAAFDGMGAPFPVSGEGLIQASRASGADGDGLRSALLARQFGGEGRPVSDWDFDGGRGWFSLRGGEIPVRGGDSIFGAGEGYANPYSALAREGPAAGLEWGSFRMALFGGTPGSDSEARGMTGSLSPSSFSDLEAEGGWVFHFGGVEEEDGFLSSEGAGVFGGVRARTGFVGVDYASGGLEGGRDGGFGWGDLSGGLRRKTRGGIRNGWGGLRICGASRFIWGWSGGMCFTRGMGWVFGFISRCGFRMRFGFGFRRGGRVMGI